MDEDILKAAHSLQFAENSFRDALAGSGNGLAGIILVDLLASTCDLRQRTEELNAAIDSD